MHYDFKLQYDPTAIPALAARYLATPYQDRAAADWDRLAEEAGWRLVNCPFDVADVGTIVLWKSHRRMDLFEQNDPSDVEAAVKDAIAATHAADVRGAIQSLTRRSGVGLKMASAILTAMFPTLYTVCDFRASHALGQKDFSSLRYYIEYLAECRAMAAQYRVSLRDFDRANWRWSKEQSKNKNKTRRCEECCWENKTQAGANLMAQASVIGTGTGARDCGTT